MANSALNLLLILALLLQNMIAVCANSHVDYDSPVPPHVHLTHTHDHSHDHSHGHDHPHSHGHHHHHQDDTPPNSKLPDLPVNHDHGDIVVVGAQLAILPASSHIPTCNETRSIAMDTSLELFQGIARTAYFEQLPDHLQAIYLQICALLL